MNGGTRISNRVSSFTLLGKPQNAIDAVKQ
jgi:hypothetical protein